MTVPATEKGEEDVEVETSDFYDSYKDHVKQLKDGLSGVVYFLFFVLILVGLWINLEEGKFPFNVRFLADTAYRPSKWGTPMAAFVIVLVLALTYLLVRILALYHVDNGLYALVEGVFKKNNLIVRVRKKVKKKVKSVVGGNNEEESHGEK